MGIYWSWSSLESEGGREMGYTCNSSKYREVVMAAVVTL